MHELEPTAAQRPNPAPPSPQPVVTLAHVRYYALMIGLAWLALRLVRDQPAVEGEALPLRWLRCCADHPLRSLSALLCLLVATRPGRGAA